MVTKARETKRVIFNNPLCPRCVCSFVPAPCSAASISLAKQRGGTLVRYAPAGPEREHQAPLIREYISMFGLQYKFAQASPPFRAGVVESYVQPQN